jgi:hypothetical protein
MSVYPAAIELARDNFNLPSILALPTYLEGGPNTHSLSPWTLMVAAGIEVSGSLTRIIPYLHAFSYVLYGLICVAIFLIIRHSTSLPLALLGTTTAGLFPPLLVQAADIYIDLPAACLIAWSAYALLRRKYVLCSALITIGIWVKPIAVVFLPALVAHTWYHSRFKQRALPILWLIGPPLSILCVMTIFGSASAGDQPTTHRFLSAALATGQLLLAVPDTFAIILSGIVVAFLALRRQRLVMQLEIATFVLLGAFTFVLLNPLLTTGIPLLPRYYIAVVPILIAGLTVQLDAFFRTGPLLFNAIACLAFVLNLSGTMYPYRSHATFVVAERSFAYRDLLAIQVEGVHALQEIGRSRPIYYDYYRHFQFQYPEMGYTNGPSPRGVSVFHHAELSPQLENLPPSFALLFEYPRIGGGLIEQIWRNAIAAGAVVSETRLKRGDYAIYIIEVDR